MTGARLLFALAVAAWLLPAGASAANGKRSPPPSAPPAAEPDEDEPPAPMPPPSELQAGIRKWKDQSYEAATLDLQAVLSNPVAAQYHDEASYYLARCLQKLGLRYAALEEYARFLAIGGDSEKFLEGFQYGVDLAERLDAGWVLAPSLTRHSDATYAREGSGAARYWVGRAFYTENQLEEARAYLMSVDRASAFYARAKFMEGVVLTRMRRPKDAVSPFQEAVNAARSAKDEHLATLGTLNLARTFYALGNFERALENYRLIPREHVDWYETLFERAWSAYMLGRLDATLAELQSVTAPFFDGLYIPEPVLLKALAFYQLCKYQDGKKLLDAFTKDHKALFEAMGKAVEAGEADRGKLFGSVSAWLLDGDRKGIPVPEPVLIYFERYAGLKQAAGYVRGVREEANRIDKLASGWGDQEVARDVVARMSQRADEQAGKKAGLVLARLRGMATQLSEFLTQAEIYKLEMITREKDLYDAASRGDVIDRLRASRTVQVPKGYRYWPFEGEYWIDEIGWYQVTTLDECKEVLRQ